MAASARLVIAIALLLACVEPAKAVPPALIPFREVPPLPAPQGQVLRAATVEQLFRAVETVEPGGTILIEDGHYRMPRYLELRTDGVTLRGVSGNPAAVILDGAESRHGELLGIRACSDVTIAHLTVRNVKWNGIKINSETNVQRVQIYHCVIHNVWQRGVKGVAVPREHRQVVRPAACRIQYCLFYNDRPKQYEDDPADRADNFGGNYVGGIDVMYPSGWTISDNVFWGIRGRTGEARGAVFLWHEAENCVVERNVIVDCDSGICLGNSHRGPETQVHAVRCLVRNNFVTRAHENGILAAYTRDCAIVHNTIHDPQSRLKRLIRVVHDNDGLLAANNLLSGPPMRIETQSPMRITGNVTGEFARFFVDPQRGDLHLSEGSVPGVTAAVPRLPQAAEDFDRRMRPDPCDVGAHQRR